MSEFLTDIQPILTTILGAIVGVIIGWFLSEKTRKDNDKNRAIERKEEWLQRDKEQKAQWDRDDVVRRSTEDHQLQIYKAQIRYSKLHDKKALIIADLYGRMIAAKGKLDHYTYTGDPNPFIEPAVPVMFEETRKALWGVSDFLETNAVWLSDDIITITRKALDEMIKINMRFHSEQRNEMDQDIPPKLDGTDSYSNAHDRLMKIAAPLLNTLHIEFQKALGAVD